MLEKIKIHEKLLDYRRAALIIKIHLDGEDIQPTLLRVDC